MRSSASVARELAEHRDRIERTIAPIRYDPSLNDRQKGCRITDILAAANARFMELHDEGRRSLEAEGTQIPIRAPSARHRPRFAPAYPSRPLGMNGDRNWCRSVIGRHWPGEAEPATSTLDDDWGGTSCPNDEDEDDEETREWLADQYTMRWSEDIEDEDD